MGNAEGGVYQKDTAIPAVTILETVISAIHSTTCFH